MKNMSIAEKSKLIYIDDMLMKASTSLNLVDHEIQSMIGDNKH